MNLNVNGLVNQLAKQAKARQQHLPGNIKQQVYLDTRGQNVTQAQLERVKDLIVQKSNGIIKREYIEFIY
ncbi:hypothetical protein [Thorsellia kenyensis]|uniref:Uncharacterized protein n=1 Tax=Thorsellia kenyensis TaxID=1549888 RepID=A0ABV6CF20_9GAMM